MSKVTIDRLLSQVADLKQMVEAQSALIEAVTNERDSLASQVEQLRDALKTYAEIEIAEGEGANLAQNALAATPSQYLSERDAEVAKVAIVSALRLYGSPDLSVSEIDNLAGRYAKQLLQSAKGGE